MLRGVSIIELLHTPIELAPIERLITPDDVGGYAAWQMLIRDGALRPFYGEAALPVKVAESVAVRAQALGLAIPETTSPERTLAVAHLAAAWVYLGGPMPPEVDLIYQTGYTRPFVPGIRLRNSQFDLSQITQVNGVWVTTKERTIRDLAVWAPDEVATPLIAELARSGADLGEAAELLERPVRLTNRPGARRVLQQVAESEILRLRAE